MANPFCSLVLVLVSVLSYQLALAVPMNDMDRVLSTFNRSYDNCSAVTDFTGTESRAAADGACEAAFKALDRLGMNTCWNWQVAKCQKIDDEQYAQCTCQIPYRKDYSSRKYKLRAFRHCAQALREKEESTRQTLAPSIHFQEVKSAYDHAWQTKSSRPVPSYRVYKDRGGIPSGGVRRSSGVYTTGEAGSSSAVHTSGGAGNPWDVYTSGFEDQSTPFPTYAPGSSGIKISKPGTKRRDHHYPPKPHACDDCKASFQTARNLLIHKKNWHKTNLRCELCKGITFATRKTFMTHFRHKHPEKHAEVKASRDVLVDQEEADVVLPHSCEFCSKRFATQKSMMSHQKSHTTELTKCQPCNLKFSTIGSLKRHMIGAHPGESIPEPEPVGEPGTDYYKCEDCGNIYLTRHGLHDHAKSHLTLDTYCGFCDKILATKDSYKTHLKRKHPKFAESEAEAAKKRYIDENPEACGKCPKRFKTERGLKDHMPSHDGLTTCDECGAKFTRISNLMGHKKREHHK